MKKTWIAGLAVLLSAAVLGGVAVLACSVISSSDDKKTDNVLDRKSDGLYLNFQGKDYSDAGSIDIYLTVHDEATDKPVNGLTNDNFLFAEDGRDMGVEVQAGVTQGNDLDILLVLDLSKSMASGGAIEQLKLAATNFIDQLSTKVRVGLVTFSDKYTVQRFFTEDLQEIRTLIQDLAPEGNFTNFYGSLSYGAGMFPDETLHVGRAIVAFTDGQDNVGQKTVKEVKDEIDKNGIFLYAVGLGPEDNLDTKDIETLSTTGRFYRADQAGQLGDIFTDIADDLQSTYKLHYCTPKVKGEHVLRITTQQGTNSGWIEISFNTEKLSGGQCVTY